MLSIPGIVCGLLAAFCQSLAYLATRHFVQRRPAGASRMLLVLSHVWMGVFSFLLLPMIWPGGGLNLRPLMWPLAATAVFYILGQFGLMIALKRIEPSRVSPLLGFKIVILAVMTATLVSPASASSAGGGLTALQWVGVGVCMVAAVSLNYSGASLPASSLFGVLLACAMYSLSDWHIALLVAGVREQSHCSYAVAAAMGACLTYAFCGVLALVFLPVQGSRRARDWLGSIPFGLAWFVAMLFLFASFGLINVVFGNILQSSRGLMSVGISSLLVRYGMLHLEPATGRGVFVRRLLSALLMFVAVVLYMLGAPPQGKIEEKAPDTFPPATSSR